MIYAIQHIYSTKYVQWALSGNRPPPISKLRFDHKKTAFFVEFLTPSPRIVASLLSHNLNSIFECHPTFNVQFQSTLFPDRAFGFLV